MTINVGIELMKFDKFQAILLYYVIKAYFLNYGFISLSTTWPEIFKRIYGVRAKWLVGSILECVNKKIYFDTCFVIAEFNGI